jgi:peptidyl-prolyl cis-trans isomerase SurA
MKLSSGAVAVVAVALLSGTCLAEAEAGAAAATSHSPSQSKPVSASAVAAVVNDKVITTTDVQQRMRLMIMNSGHQITQAMFGQLQQQALQDLVEEQLKFEEADRFKVEVTDAEVDAEIATIARDAGLTPDEMRQQLKSTGIEISGLKSQLRATLIWQRIVQGRFRDRVRIRPADIDAALQRMREDATNEQFLVSEICIPVENPDQTEQLYKGSLNLIEQMKKGVPFSVVAQQFSACTSAAAGGDLGWIRAGELAPELDGALKALPPGSVTNPILSEGALMILAMRDKRPARVAGEETYTVVYAGAPESMGRDAIVKAFEKLPAADACGVKSTMRQDIGPGVGVTLLENIKASEIDPRFRESITNVPRGQLGSVVEADKAFHVALVCERDEGLGLPSREALEDRAYGRELSRIAQQYLRDLQRKASVDIRLTTSNAQSTG